MISTEEFRAAAEAEHRRFFRRLLVLSAAMLIGMGLFFALMIVFRDRLQSKEAVHPDSRQTEFWMKLGYGVSMLPSALALWLMMRRLTKDQRLRCQHCQRGLAKVSDLVLRGGNCAYCGKRVLDPPPTDLLPSDVAPRRELMAASEFAAFVHDHQRRTNWILAATIGGLVAYFPILGIVLCLLPGPRWNLVAEHYGETSAMFMFALLIAPEFLILFVVGVGGICLLDRRSTRNPRLRCPDCDKPLVENGTNSFAVVSTRQCPYCNAFILSEPQADPNHSRLRRLDDFNAGCRRIFREWVLTGAGVIVLLSGLAVAGNSLQTWHVRQFGKDSDELMFFAILIVYVVLIGLGFSLALYFSSHDPRVLCPSCRGSMIEQKSIVVSTRRCCHCGQVAIAEPSDVLTEPS